MNPKLRNSTKETGANSSRRRSLPAPIDLPRPGFLQVSDFGFRISFGFRPSASGFSTVLALLLSFVLLTAVSALSASTNRLDYMIVVTGTELLEGAYPDAHTHFLTRALMPMGLHCVGSVTVDDREADVKEALRLCAQKAPLIIVTGGLGPTDNDVTRQALGQFTKIPLEENPEVLADLQRRYASTGTPLRPNMRRQSRVPSRGGYLKNPNGTAVGLVFEMETNVIVALPGPPRELQPMVRNELIPYLGRRFGTRTQSCSLTLRFVGVGQSQIAQTIRDHVPVEADIAQGSLFEGSRVDFSFSLPDSSATNQARLRELEEKILEHLREYFYADDDSSLEDHVVRLLRARGVTLAVAEAGSGGAFTAALSLARDATNVLAGAWVAGTEQTLTRLVPAPGDARPTSGSSDDILKEIAVRIQAGAATRWVVVVGAVRRDASGAAFIPVALRQSDTDCEVRRFTGGSSTAAARAALTTQILDWLRHKAKSGT